LGYWVRNLFLEVDRPVRTRPQHSQRNGDARLAKEVELERLLLHQRLAPVGRGCGSGRAQISEVGRVVFATTDRGRTEGVGCVPSAIRASGDCDLYARCRSLCGSERHERAVHVKLVRLGRVEQALLDRHHLLVVGAPGIDVEEREAELVQHDWGLGDLQSGASGCWLSGGWSAGEGGTAGSGQALGPVRACVSGAHIVDELEEEVGLGVGE
jgi:hypothetical protein